MKLLLIFPPQDNFYLGSIKARFFAEESGAYPPLGLLSLATNIFIKGTHEVKVLDAIAEGLSHAQIEQYIAKERPDVVGVTCITDYLLDTIMVAKSAKRVSGDIKVIFGGHHVNLFPAETIRIKEVDYAVMGDADLVMDEILNRLSQGKSVDDLPGVFTKENYTSKPLQRIIVDSLDDLPILKRDLVDYHKYKTVIAKGSPVTTMLTSRGCPFSCPYCSGGNIKSRSNSTKRVLDEIESCLNLGINDILFFDELFTMNKRRVNEICDGITRRSFKFRWHARARIDSVDVELLKKMKKAGLRLLQFGIETGTDRIQKILERKLTIDKIREVIKVTQGEGILTYGNFMFNSPTETKEEMQRTIDFAKELDLDYAVFGVLTAFPKTHIYDELLKGNKISEDFWQKFVDDPQNYRIKSSFWPGEFNDQELNEWVEKAFSTFYIRPRYFIKALFRDETLGQKFTQVRSGINVLKRYIK